MFSENIAFMPRTLEEHFESVEEPLLFQKKNKVSFVRLFWEQSANFSLHKIKENSSVQ